MHAKMTTEFAVSRPVGRCAISGRDIKPGEVFHTALFEQGEAFERRDYAAECWTGPPEGAFCAFRTRLAEKPSRKSLLVDDDVLMQFFLRLADAGDAGKRNFRFVLALILMRKRLLKYERTRREETTEIWELRGAKDGQSHRVINPRLDEEQVAAVTAELSAILAGGEESEPP